MTVNNNIQTSPDFQANPLSTNNVPSGTSTENQVGANQGASSGRLYANSLPQTSSTQSNTDSHYNQVLLKIVTVLIQLETLLGKVEANNLNNQAEMGKENTKIQDDASQKRNKELQKHQDEVNAARHRSRFMKIFSIVIGVLAIALSAIFLGPGAALAAGAMFAMEESGAMNKMTKNMSLTGKIFTSLAVGIALGGMGAAGDLATGAANTAASIAKSVATKTANIATKAAADAIQIAKTSTDAAEIAAAEAFAATAKESADALSKVAAEESAKEVANQGTSKSKKLLSSFKFNAANGAIQSLISTNSITGLVAKMTKDKKLQAWLTAIITFLVTLIAMLSARPGANTLSFNPKMLSKLSSLGSLAVVAGQGTQIGAQFTQAKALQEMADTTEQQGNTDKMMVLLKSINDMLDSLQQTSSRRMQANAGHTEKDLTALDKAIVAPAEALARAVESAA